MRIALCDDSNADRALIRNILEEYEKVSDCELVFEEYDSGKEMIAALKNNEIPDIILLDINMDDMDGLEAASRIRQILPEIPIILVTAYMSYALDGYKVKANRFLVKDDLAITLPECMDDMIEELSEKQRELTFDFIEGLRRQMDGGALQNELMKHFDFDVDTPTKSAFCQQRAKVSPEALKFFFCIFTEMLMGIVEESNSPFSS